MNQIDFQKYIQGDLDIGAEKSMRLKQTLQKYPGYLLSLSEFANKLDAFRRPTFEDLRSPKKSELITELLEALEKKKFNPAFGEILEILFGEEGKEGQNTGDCPASFLNLILNKGRLPENSLISPLIVELMLACSNVPLQGSSIIDYIPGLHQESDLFRCKILNFLYQNFGEEVLPKMIHEVLKMTPPPSVLFCGTLEQFFCRHPNVRWAKMLKTDDLNLNNWDRKEGRWLFLKEMMNSCSRIQFLSLITDGDHPKNQGENRFKLKTNKGAFALRRDRFNAIEFQSTRR